MQYRHELKQEISYIDYLVLRQRLSAVMQKDTHTIDGKYEIRSIYFDTMNDKALREKIDGVNVREKFRIRYYNGDLSYIKLEKKSKVNGLCKKESVLLSEEETKNLLSGNYEWIKGREEALLQELYVKMLVTGLKPKTIVDYTREPFIFCAGNVRVTLDYNIRTGMLSKEFLNDDSVTVLVPDNPIILEVKWDEFLPDIIREIIQSDKGRIGAFSKYAASRKYV